MWQCERLVASFEVTGLIALQRDWFRFSCRGCSGLQTDGGAQGKRREKAGRAVRKVDSWAWSEKGWRSFDLDLNRTLLLQVPLLLSPLLHQQVAVALVLPLLLLCFCSILLWPMLPLQAFNVSVRDPVERSWFCSYFHGKNTMKHLICDQAWL